MPGRYRVEIGDDARRQLAKLPPPIQSRLKAKIQALSDHPRPPTAKKLSGQHDLYRLRVGDYRAIYSVHDEVLLVIVVRIAHRSRAYQRLPTKGREL